jgi:hypothetical protein
MGIEPSPEIDDVSFGSATGSSCLSERLVVFTNQSKKPAGESRQTTHPHPDLLLKTSSVATILSGEVHYVSSECKRSQPVSMA